MGGVELRRERLTLPDTDFLDLDWAVQVEGREVDPDSPLVLVIHGLEGSSQSGYSKELYRAFGKRGVACVGMNFRSCSGELNRLPRLYHSGETTDLAFVLQTLSSRFPDRKFGAVGVSLGGNVLLKFLGEAGERGEQPLTAAATISVPFDLSVGADHVETGFSRVYRWSLVGRLKKKVRAKAALLKDIIDVGRTLESRTFREFDGASTAPLHGFIDAEDYYSRSSSARYVDRIRTPTVLIQSFDDPFLPADAVPTSAVNNNPFTTGLFTERGGHVGFVAGTPWEPVFWAERAAASLVTDELQRI
jgi:predicted alpha/beta-fold hydrolase